MSYGKPLNTAFDSSSQILSYWLHVTSKHMVESTDRKMDVDPVIITC